MTRTQAGPGMDAAPDGSAAALCVSTGNETLLLPLAAVREVLRPLPLTRMPHAPGFLLGLCNLRGAALPVLSLRVLRGGGVASGAEATGPGARIVVATMGGSNRIGLLVEAVLPADTPDAQRIDPGTLLPASAAPPTQPRGGTLAGPAAAEQDAVEAGPALLGFRVGAREFALPLDAVLSVAALGTMTPVAEPAPAAMPHKVPGTDAAMLGVVAAHDGLLPVLDAAVLLGLLGPPPRTHGARMVVARINRRAAGLAVDAVTGILRPPMAAVEPVPPLLLRGLNGEARIDSLCRLENGRRVVQVLHPDRLLDDATMQRLAGLDAGTNGDAEAMAEMGAAAAGREQVLLFDIGAERYALPVASVVAVVRHSGSLPRLPNGPGFVEGVMILRGRVIPVIDGRQRFGLPAVDGAGRRRIVVVSAGGLPLGLAVDRASVVSWFAAEALSPAPGFGAENRLFDRVAATDGAGMVLLVDPAALLDGVERDLLAAAMAAAPGMPAGAQAFS